jgi:cytochrome c-type biogenesis protein CcmF
MLWAYEELGWGGYWAWDPVENAGLIPWLTSTAYIHSVMVQERRGMLKVWNVLLAIITFELTIFGTFLTRSGFVQSVHAFAQSSIGYYFLTFMGLVLVVSVALLWWRWPRLRSRGELESVVSREFSFMINNWILLSAAFLVLVLTIFPTVSQISGNKVTISAPAFNRWMVPIGLALLFLKAFGPMIGWRKTTAAGLRRQFLIPLVAAAASLGTLLAFGARGVLPLSTFTLCALVLGTVVVETARGVRVRRRSTGADPLTALLGLFGKNRRRYGGYLVHVGVALMFIGFGGEAYKQESEVQLARGQRARLGRYTIRYDDTQVTRDDQKEMTTATLSLYRDDQRVGVVHPARWLYFKHEDRPTTEVDIRRTAMEDLFVILGSYDPGLGTATFKVIINPLVTWMWIGFVLLSLGTGIALAPSGARKARRVPAAVVGLLLAFVVLGAGSGVTLAAEPPTGGTVKEATSPVVIVSEAERRLFSKIACMCPTCPRIPLSTCQCGFAGNERDAIRKKIHAGWSEERILHWYLEERGAELGRERFGQVALTTPPDTGWNRLSWLVPYLVSLVAVVLLLLVGKRWVRAARLKPTGDRAISATPSSVGAAPLRPGEANPGLDSEERGTYERLLDQELKKLD